MVKAKGRRPAKVATALVVADAVAKKPNDRAVKLPNECAVSAGSRPRVELVPQPHGGAIARPWTSDTAPRTGGAPAGFIPPTEAYKVVSVFTLPDLRRIAAGEPPLDPRWPSTRVVSAGYSAMAGQIVAAADGATPAAREYADRVEGPVTQRVESLSASYLVELPSVAPEAAVWAAARSAPRLAAAIAQADGDGGGADHA